MCFYSLYLKYRELTNIAKRITPNIYSAFPIQNIIPSHRSNPLCPEKAEIDKRILLINAPIPCFIVHKLMGIDIVDNVFNN